MPPRRISRDESWQSLHRSEVSADNDEDGYTDISMEDSAEQHEDTMRLEAPIFPTVNDVRKALHPLQATADRVGQQVEEFAKSLDRVNTKTKKDTVSDCRHVLPFVNEYRKIASNTVKSLRAKHGMEREKKAPRRSKSKSGRSTARSPGAASRSANGGSNDKLTTVEDLLRWEEEEQTWDLLGSMLQVEFPIPEKDRSTIKHDSKDKPWLTRPEQKLNMNHFSSEKETWDNFLASDDLAWERFTVVEWLKRCADRSRPEIDHIVEELESEADRGSGLWAHSWLYTKEAIKGQKRLRSWPQALEPDNPGLDTSLVGTKSKKALVTQLDPDAISRQGRELEQQDSSFERAIWVACWEMLRRGKDWQFVHNWCQDRGELWRSTAMRSSLQFAGTSTANWRSRHLWRKTCALASKTGGNDDYEKAVYGLLSGYLPSVLNIARGWDDHLFAHYSSFLLQSFERYQKVHYSDRIPFISSDVLQFSVFSGQRTQSGNQIVEKMKTLLETKEEALQPLKMLQGSLIARSIEDFFIKQGVRITRVANAKTVSKTIEALPLSMLEATQTAPIDLADYDLLRVFTHVILIFIKMGFSFGGGNRRYAVDSIVVAYIDFLSRAGKQQLIPLYASHLAPERIADCMCRQLPFVLDSEERKIMMKLMVQYEINVPAVLAKQMHLIMLDASPKKSASSAFPKLELQETSSETHSFPYKIRSRFMGTNITDEQYDLIHGLEWFLLLDGEWVSSMYYGATIYKHFLRTSAFAAGRLLSRSVTFSSFSLSKTQGILGRVTDVSKDHDFSDPEDSPRKASRNIRNTRSKGHRSKASISDGHAKLERDVLLLQGKSYLDLEQLFNAFDAIERWKDLSSEAEQFTNRQQDGRAWRERKGPFQKAFLEVEAAVGYLTHEWLDMPRNEAESKTFHQIRLIYLPEIILAYNTILNFSSRYLTRSLFLKSMNLAASIAAAADSSEVARCFIEAGRMPELVKSFAWTSKNMILADSTGRSSRSSGGGGGGQNRSGEGLGLWTVRAEPEEEDDEDEDDGDENGGGKGS